jgi:hypothetical protein
MKWGRKINSSSGGGGALEDCLPLINNELSARVQINN